MENIPHHHDLGSPHAAWAWAFHRGALGDGVLLWPMLRRLAAAGPVALVSARGAAVLAAREVPGVVAVDAEAAEFVSLWREGATPRPRAGVRRVVAWAGGSPTERTWVENARRMFKGARFTIMKRRADSRLARRFSVAGLGPTPRTNPAGPIVMHVGAGGEAKRWPMVRWLALAESAGGLGAVELLAGEVEADRLAAADRRAFERAGGRFVGVGGDTATGLLALADILRTARAFVGADSGPAHLAAQLGVTTLALFGPTDPTRWAPVGPRVRVLAPPAPAAMPWLSVALAAESLRALLG